MRTIILFLSICIAQMVAAQSGITLSGGIDVFKPITGKGEILGYQNLQITSSGASGVGIEIYNGLNKKLYFSTFIGLATEHYHILNLEKDQNSFDYQFRYGKISQAIHIKSETKNPAVWWHMTAGAAVKVGKLSVPDEWPAELPLVDDLKNIELIRDIELFLGLGFLHPLSNIGSIDYTFGMHITPFNKNLGYKPENNINENPEFRYISRGYPMLKIRYIPFNKSNKNQWSRKCS